MMNERQIVLDTPSITDEASVALRRAIDRAEAAETEVAHLKAQLPAHPSQLPQQTHLPTSEGEEGEAELRKDTMLAHLLDALAAGTDIGHYGRLVFAMVARHFLPREDVLRHLTQDKDFSAEQASRLLAQVEEHNYNPPRRDRILEWQSQQEFPILPNPADPDCGNLYRTLKFPDAVYTQIDHYQEEKVHAAE